MASEHAASSSVQAHFVGLMRDLCVSDEIADEIAEAGGVEKILDAAHRHYDQPDVLMEVADAMRNLTATEHIAMQAAKGGAIEVLVDAAARHVKDEAVSRAVVGALWALSVHDGLISDLVRLGCVQAVLVARAANKTRMPFGGSTKNVTPGTAKGNLSSRLNPLMSKRKSKGGGDGGMEHV